jgi:hypothetical protein
MSMTIRMSPISQRHLECDLYARRTAVGKKDVLETLGDEGQKAFRKLFGRLMGVLGEDDLIEGFGLRLDRGDYVRMAVPMGNDPP